MSELPPHLTNARFVNATGEAAAAAADYDMMRNDLEHVAEMCRQLPTVPAGIEFQALFRALWESAIISYSRCFTTGRGFTHLQRRRPRHRLGTELDTLFSDEQLEFHNTVCEERDGHIAHRTDMRSYANIILVLLPESNAGISHIEYAFVRNIGGDDRAQRLAELVSVLLPHVVRRRDDLHDEILREESKSLEELYSRAQPDLVAQDEKTIRG